jgi:hypothetical protein
LVDSQKKPCTLNVKVIGSDNTQAGNAKVMIRNVDSTLLDTYTNSAGEISAQLPEGQYIISSKINEFVHVSNVMMIAGIERNIKMMPVYQNNGGYLRFYVYDSTNRPIEGINVALVYQLGNYSANFLPFSYYLDYFYITGKTDHYGKISFNDIPSELAFTLFIYKKNRTYYYEKKIYKANNYSSGYQQVLIRI